jgi:collagen type I/II/III/V/XI/XXIV/XXVII alpha
MPARDLLVSPDHAIYVDDVLIPAKLLINGTTIRQEQRRRVVYHHVELAEHDVILAEGLPAETYLDTGDRAKFSGAQVIVLHPDFSVRVLEAMGCAPFVVTGSQLGSARTRIDLRAAAMQQYAAATVRGPRSPGAGGQGQG